MAWYFFVDNEKDNYSKTNVHLLTEVLIIVIMPLMNNVWLVTRLRQTLNNNLMFM